MATTITHPRPSPPNTNGHQATTLVRGRSVNRPRVAAGVLLVVLCILATVALLSSASDSKSVLVASRTIAPGETITPGDLRTIDLDSRTKVNAIDAERSHDLLGRTAKFTIPAGALVMSSQIADGPTIPAGSEITGAIVRPGQFPVGLRVGDQVRLIESVTAADAGVGAVEGHERGAAVVTDVHPLDDASGGLAISLAVPTDTSVEVAAAGAAGRLSLVVTENR